MIKKRLFAFLLVVVLTMALMLPTLAATGTSVQADCKHNWVLLDRTIDRYQMVNATYHHVYYYYDHICTLCAKKERAVGMEGYYSENHTIPCYKCRAGVRMVQE